MRAYADPATTALVVVRGRPDLATWEAPGPDAAAEVADLSAFGEVAVIYPGDNADGPQWAPSPRLVRALGADHVAWVLRGGVDRALCAARGAWDCNDVENVGAYDALAEVLGVTAFPNGGWSGPSTAYFRGRGPKPPDRR